VVKWLRIVGSFLIDLLLAVIGPTFLGAEIHIHAYDRSTMILNEDFRSAGIAFVLGFFAHYFRKTQTSRWVWTVALVWFAQRAVIYWNSQHYLRVLLQSGHSIYWEMSGAGAAFNLDVQSLNDWAFYTLPLVRTVLYSAGAFLCWYLFRRGWSGWKIFSRSRVPEPSVSSEPTSE